MHRYLHRPSNPWHPLMLAHPPQSLRAIAPQPVDWRSKFMPCRDQGNEGSCSGFSAAAFRESLRAILGQSLVGYLSPQYLYARTRQSEGTFPQDSGCTIADEFTTLIQRGVPNEVFAPYTADPSFNPDAEADAIAASFKLAGPVQLATDADTLKAALASAPVVIGFSVPASMEGEDVAATGMLATPGPSEANLGGHAVVLVGWDESDYPWIIRNSWGTSWGGPMQGYFRAWPGFTDLISEAWTSRPQ